MGPKTPRERLPVLAQAEPPVSPYRCPHYQPLLGSKRCVSYDESGICMRDDEFVCVEWLRVNRR